MKDFAVIGNWYGLNYGSALTYYALCRLLEIRAYSFDLIDTSYRGTEYENCNNKSKKFLSSFFGVIKLSKDSDLKKLNEHYKGFITGSDQLWNRGISRRYDYIYYLNFVNNCKFKAAVATSFGHEADFANEVERKIISSLFKRFDYISLREYEGQTICRDCYDVYQTDVIMDPVFLNYRDFKKIKMNSDLRNDRYLLAYILDIDENKKRFVKNFAIELGVTPIFVIDGDPINYFNRCQVLSDSVLMSNSLSHIDWLNLIKNSTYVITDSFHGACFSIIFKKEFICIKNRSRGISRFNSISRFSNFNNRFIDYEGGDLLRDSKTIYEFLNCSLDYDEAFKFIDLKVKYDLKRIDLLLKYYGENYV